MGRVQHGTERSAQVLHSAGNALEGLRSGSRGRTGSPANQMGDSARSGSSGDGGIPVGQGAPPTGAGAGPGPLPEADSLAGSPGGLPPTGPMKRRSLDSFDDEELLDIYIREFMDGEDPSEIYARSIFADDMAGEE